MALWSCVIVLERTKEEIKMITPELTVKILEAEVNDVRGYFASLTESDLQKASACENWAVADVMAHLAGQDHASRVRRGL